MTKTNYSYIGIAFIILVFGIIFVPRIVNRVSSNDITREESRSKKVSTASIIEQPLTYLLINGERKKVPQFSFTNQDGQTITNSDFDGKVYLLEFFFTTCPTICPRMSKNLVDIQNAFPNREDFGIASITINPENDTPEVLKQYAEAYGVTHPNWHFLTGDRDAIYELANVGFNLYAAQDPNVPGGFEHSGNFALVDQEGYIRSRHDAYGNPLIYYNGIISETEGYDEDGEAEQISWLKSDILKLLNDPNATQ